MFEFSLRENLFRDLFDFRRDFDEIFNRLLQEPLMLTEPKIWTEPKLQMSRFTPPAECWVDTDAKKFYMRIALPGVHPEDVELKVLGNTLTIKGERKIFETKKEVNYLLREFSLGAFERTLPLPEGVDVERLVAEFNHGLLEISAPLMMEALPRKIEIKTLVKAKAA
jgi:HSP20 family protein